MRWATIQVLQNAMGHHTGASKCHKSDFNLRQVFEIVTTFLQLEQLIQSVVVILSYNVAAFSYFSYLKFTEGVPL